MHICSKYILHNKFRNPLFNLKLGHNRFVFPCLQVRVLVSHVSRYESWFPMSPGTSLGLPLFFLLLYLAALLPVFHLLIIYPSPFSVFRGIPPPVSAMFISICEPSPLGGSLEYKVSTVSSVAIAVLSSKISPRLVSLLTLR